MHVPFMFVHCVPHVLRNLWHMNMPIDGSCDIMCASHSLHLKETGNNKLVYYYISPIDGSCDIMCACP